MGCLSLWLALLCCVHCSYVRGFLRDDDVVTEPLVLTHVLDAEIDANRRQLELYKRNQELLGRAILQLQHQTKKNASISEDPGSGPIAAQRHYRPRESPQIFSDWFEPQGAFSPPRNTLARLISFRPNTSPMGRRQQMSARRKASVDEKPPLQFLLVVDPHSTVMSLFHPTTFELMWQHALNLRSASGQENFQVTDMFFVSDRSAYLALLSTSGELALFKLRLWHGRRIVAGDPRRLKPLREVEEDQLQCAMGQDSLSTRYILQPPWLQQSTSVLTTPGPGRYLHVDVERVFGATLRRDQHYDHGKVTVVTMYYRVLVVASDSSGGHLSFFNGDNGSFVDDIHTQIGSHDGGVVNLEPIQSSRGLVALVTPSRVFFVDATVPLLIPVACEAPGRHAFASLAADPLRPSLLYVGTSTGRGLVYKLHNLGSWRQRVGLGDGETQGSVMCTLVDQLLPRRPPFPAFSHEAPAVMETMPGFLLLGSGSRLVLYQLSGSNDEVHPTYLSERSLVDPVIQVLHPSAPYPRALAVSAAKDLVVHPTGFAVLVEVPPTPNATVLIQRLDMYESRIPPPGTNLDLSWIRVPAMMICALAAMFWQQKGRLAYSAGGRSAFNEAELAGLLSGRGGRLPSMNRGGLSSTRRPNNWY
ncbi:hypothetical protein KRP22_001662 [Phytophthora ramorum]|nr:hypothetical protein KRP22_943 [Phytophthora ramorum]